ncbi:hypothetical protein PoB_004322300 [Plakobranchus ocellatus]|uniref:Uncharacterized protein n=1 Tax=Plakobranchus ocellatus TaxID=259542 RepID=A0AAV4BAX2_9GAST|nr:hypothetical protein PoB_004322300 [Plakobranchus ocellatus]
MKNATGTYVLETAVKELKWFCKKKLTHILDTIVKTKDRTGGTRLAVCHCGQTLAILMFGLNSIENFNCC